MEKSIGGFKVEVDNEGDDDDDVDDDQVDTHQSQKSRQNERDRERERASLSASFYCFLSLSLTFTHTCFLSLSLSLSSHKGRKSSKCDSNFFPLLPSSSSDSSPPSPPRLSSKPPRSYRTLKRQETVEAALEVIAAFSRHFFGESSFIRSTIMKNIFYQFFLTDCTSHRLLASNLNEDLFL